MTVKLFVDLEIRNKDGSLVSKTQHEGHSLVVAFLALIFEQMASTKASVSAVDTIGFARTLSNNTIALNTSVLAGFITYGIVVGTDDTPVTLDDFGLGLQILNGTTAGQLLHSAVTYGPIEGDATFRRFATLRTFTCDVGATIVVVKELGLYTRGYSLGTKFFMSAREVIPPQTINPGQALSATLQIQIDLT